MVLAVVRAFAEAYGYPTFDYDPNQKRDNDGRFATEEGSGAEEPATTDEIKAFVNYAISNPKGSGELYVGRANERLIKEAVKAGRDLRGYEHFIDFGGVRHSNKGHGEGNEKDEHQIPLTPDDFAKIPDIVDNFDNVKFNTRTDHRGTREAAVYTKKYPKDGTIRYIEQIVQGGKLITKTMYKKEIKKK